MKKVLSHFWKDIEASQTEIQFTLKRAPSKALTHHEFVFFSKDLSAQDPEAWSALPAHLWTKEALQRWGQILPKPSEQKDHPVATIEWCTGDTVRAQFLPHLSSLTNFELHTLLREHWSAPWQARIQSKPLGVAPLLLNLETLGETEQKRILSALIFLANTCTWKPYSFAKTPSKQSTGRARKKTLTVDVHCTLATADFQAILTQSTQLAHCNNWVRTLTDLPANFLNPGNYRELATQLAKLEGWKTEFLSTQKLKAIGAEAFLAVTRADPGSESGILKISYRPKKAKKRLHLVGKGLCFDTGGYNIKTGAGMNGMHSDMSGSAVVLACLAYFAKTQSDIEVTAYLALAENLISPTAFKPNEVVTACDGTTIEVVDTDAEGRMVLSDTLALARREKPDLCIDFATLTGAAIRALDTRMGAVFTNRPEWNETLVRAGQSSGERVWPFPLEPDYKKQLKSEVADLLQCTHGNNSDHIYAATFLAHFIGEETPWIHLDLSAAKNRGGLGLIGTTTTGFGVQWTVETVKQVLGLNG
jgi:leucyl aminopeptidase